MLEEPWQITLCGKLEARQGRSVIARFRTQKTGILLAYLAYYQDRTHGREALADLFWPDTEKSLHSLRMALTSLRQQLEPPGVPAGSVLIADRTRVRLAPEAIHTDIAEFNTLFAQAENATESVHKVALLTRAVEAITGELLPDCYEEWALQERRQVSERLRNGLQTLISLLQTLQETERALAYAVRLLHLDTLNEAAHLQVMHLLHTLKRPAEACAQFVRLTNLLRQEVDAEPSPEAYAMAAACGYVGSQAASVPGNSSDDAHHATQGDKAASSEDGSPAITAETDSPNRSVIEPSSLTALPPQARLPLPLSAFFGRKEECEEIARLLTPLEALPSVDTAHYSSASSHPVRLLTLLGTGGIGKTRLAIKVGRDLAIAFGQAVCFVSLVEADTSEHILEAILEALQSPLQPNTELIDQVCAALGDAPFLLILDNLEQIAEIGAEIVSSLLQKLPALKILVTSRTRLAIEGEQELVLASLPIPDYSSSPEQLMEFAGVQLFVDKAQAARADFQLTPRNAEAVTTLCQRLDGLPLALELAAGWAQVLTPAQMLERLDQRFALLKTRRKGITVRHQALQACIEWSFRLLPTEVQDFFSCLSVFRGGWGLEAAEAVCGEGEALERLQRLRDASFILIEEVQSGGATEMRYRLLETLREFGQEQLDAEQRIRACRSHAHYFVQYAERVGKAMKGAQQIEWLERAEREHDNFRQSLRWCGTQEEEAGTQLRMAGDLWRFWYVRGFAREGRAQLERALARSENRGVSEERVRALNGAGVLAWHQGDYGAAEERYHEAVAMARLRGDKQALAECLGNLGNVALFKGDYKTAQDYLEQCRALFLELNNSQGVALCLINLGLLASSLMKKELARSYYREAYEVFMELGDTRHAVYALSNSAWIACDLGDYATAWMQFAQCLPRERELKDLSGTAIILEGMAVTCCDPLRAACLFGASQILQEKEGNFQMADNAYRDTILARFEVKEISEAWQRGRTMTLDQMIDFALEKSALRSLESTKLSGQAG